MVELGNAYTYGHYSCCERREGRKGHISPVKDMRTDIAEVKTQEKAHEKEAKEHFEEIDEILQKQEETNQIMLKALFHLVNHSIDGNGIEGLKKVRNELSNSIIER